jgi:chorismate mutase
MTARDRQSAELRALRRRIDALDRRIVALLTERTELTRSVGSVKSRGGRAIRDAEREREVLLRVSMANTGPIPQADLLAIYRRLMAATRAVQQADLDAAARTGPTIVPAGDPAPDEAPEGTGGSDGPAGDPGSGGSAT